MFSVNTDTKTASVKVKKCSQVLTHTCNPSLSGSRDQEDQGSKPVRANSL
jgi:hypothetical protein